MTSLLSRVFAATAEAAEALRVEVENSTHTDIEKQVFLARLSEVEFTARVDAATAEETEDLRGEIEADTLLPDTLKTPLLDRLSGREARLSEVEFTARVDAATAEKTEDLRGEIEADTLLPDTLKKPLLDRLSGRELNEFGNFFTLIDELFVKDETYDAAKKVKEGGEFNFYKSCCRSLYPPPLNPAQARLDRLRKRNGDQESRPAKRIMHCRTKSGVSNDVYHLTYSHAQKSREAATNNGQSKQSSHASARRALWPTNVVGQRFAQGMEIAHLVPSSRKDADSYWFVTDFLFGRDSTPRQWDETCRLIHGSNGPKGNGVEKVANTGIKHMVTNKILLASQKDYLDRTPCVIIVPILHRNGDGEEVTALNWSGEAYDAMMLIDSYDEDEDDYEISPLRTVATATGYTYYDRENENKATSDEVKKAMKLFCDYTRAIYYAQDKLKPTETEFSMEGEAGLFYPKLLDNYEHLNVRKISFASHNSMDGHPPPDPLLLLSKSIAVLQARHGFRIMAAAEPSDSVLPSDESIQAEEEYLRRREQLMNHRDPLGMFIHVG